VGSYTAASDTDVLLFLNFLLLLALLKKQCVFSYTHKCNIGFSIHSKRREPGKFIALPALEPSFKVKPKFQTFYCSQYTV